MHCFSGNFKLAKKVVSNGWYFSIPVTILKSTHFQGIVELTPLNQILTETDAPFLAPPEKEINEPAFIKLTVGKIMKIKGLPRPEIEKELFTNYQRIFNI